MKKRMNSHKQLCFKDNCCGLKNNQQNFLNANTKHIQSTSRVKKNVNKTLSIKKINPQTKNIEQINKILQQSYNQLKQQNTKLIKKLNLKKKKIQEQQSKIDELQTSLENYSLQLEHFQSLLKAYEQKKQTDDLSDKNTKGLKYQTIIEAQQALTKQTLQKYKSLEKQYQKYRNQMEKNLEEDQRKIKKLENQQIEIKSKLENERTKFQLQKNKLLVQKKYENQVQNIKKQLSSYQNRSVREKTSIQMSTLQAQLCQLRQKNSLLQDELLYVSSKLKQNELSFELREKQLLSNLDKINQKVIKFERQTKSNTKKKNNESREWKEKYEQLMEKYLKKKEKYFNKNEEWAQIFKQFMIEIDRLKKQIAYISERNVKLVQLYVEGETKDN